MNIQERKPILEAITKLAAGEAENVGLPFERVFLPLNSHKIALHSTNVIIRGGRGVGKSALFKILQQLKTSNKLRTLFNDPQIPDALWIDAFSQTTMDHPSVEVLDKFAQDSKNDMDRLRAFWMGHLLQRLDYTLKENKLIPADLQNIMKQYPPNDLQAWVTSIQSYISQVANALDECDKLLSHRKQMVFAIYDHLDRIGPFNQDLRRCYVGALLALWLSLSNRYSHLKSKIFLREDIFDSCEVSFPDASKLRARSVSIEWDIESLYRVAIRYISAASDESRRWLEKIEHGFVLTEEFDFGWMPSSLSEEARKSFASLLAGKLMGKGGNKGYTYRWIPNHLKDAKGSIVPRSMLNLFGFAAQSASNSPLTNEQQLLRPKDLYDALEETSKCRVREIQEEYPIVNRMENLRDMNVMLDHQVLIEKIKTPFKGEFPVLTTDGNAAFEELIRLGVISVRRDGRVDVPDIYRSGFGIKRKGGIARVQ